MNLLSLFTFLLPGNIWDTLYINPPNRIMRFNILLQQQNIDILEQELIKRTNPYSEHYGQWLTTDKIEHIITPLNYDPLINWLNKNNIVYINNTDNLECSGTKNQINGLFNTSLGQNKKTIYHLPDDVKPHIDMILGYRNHYQRDILKPRAKNTIAGQMIISPESIHALYNVTYATPSKYSSQSVVEFLNDQCYNNDDLQVFLNDSNYPNNTVPHNHFWGKCDPATQDPDIEATLDIQYQTGINNNSLLYYVSVSDWLYQFSNFIFKSKNPPKVLSMSYGWAEWDQCDSAVFPTCLLNVSAQEYSQRTNIEFMKLGLRGITLVASSGDAGAPGRTNEGCNGDNALNPAFPASSPWVLAVGGTIFMNATEIKNPKTPMCEKNSCIGGGVELNCNIDRCGWTSGGGFSNFFNRPPWQDNASTHFLNISTDLPPNKLYNKNGRIYPDVSLVSHNYLINTPQGYSTVDGTSASAPSVSAMISILNNMRVSKGKSTLGPVAPLLYNMVNSCDDCFKDIEIGSNNSTEEADCEWGYHATKGFDAVYGLGVPNFREIYNYVDNL